MSSTHLVSDPSALMDDPPDILLTNYKMLDRLLTTPRRQRLWAANTPPKPRGGWEQPLTYLVLDEFHTYDGAQGTDVAMLLRRLGHRLGVATAQSPLTGVAPIGTSATLGSSQTAAADMCRFASRVFGVRFDAAVDRRRAAANGRSRSARISTSRCRRQTRVSVAQIDLIGSRAGRDALARAFTGVGFDDAQAVGDRLLRHHITASLLRVAADRPRLWADAVAAVAQQVPDWGRFVADDPAAVAAALERFVALVSQARGRTSTNEPRPLFSVEVQVWIRAGHPAARDRSTRRRGFAGPTRPADPESSAIELPSIHCTACGRSGWMAVANRAAGQGAARDRATRSRRAGGDLRDVGSRPRAHSRADARQRGRAGRALAGLSSPGRSTRPTSNDARIPVLVGGMTGDDRSESEPRRGGEAAALPVVWDPGRDPLSRVERDDARLGRDHADVRLAVRRRRRAQAARLHRLGPGRLAPSRVLLRADPPLQPARDAVSRVAAAWSPEADRDRRRRLSLAPTASPSRPTRCSR